MGTSRTLIVGWLRHPTRNSQVSGETAGSGTKAAGGSIGSFQPSNAYLEALPSGSHRRSDGAEHLAEAIDDCTRTRVLKIYDACNQETAVEFTDEVLRRLPFRVHLIQTDNGSE